MKNGKLQDGNGQEDLAVEGEVYGHWREAGGGGVVISSRGRA